MSAPRWLSPVPESADSRGGLLCDFIEQHCRITKDSVAGHAGELIQIRSWQRKLLEQLYVQDDGRRRYRTALVGLPRKNGKSALFSGVALFELVAGVAGAEVYSCAADREQARIVFGTAKRMVELDPDLSEVLTLYKDAIEYKDQGSVYRVLSAEAFTKEGLNPTAVMFDEVHAQPKRDLWDVMALAMGARKDPLLAGITTAGVRTNKAGEDSLCYELYQYGKQVSTGEVDDPSFFFSWWEPEAGTDADHTDPEVWKEANPGFGDLIDPRDFETAVQRTPEAEFRIKRTNVWVSSQEAWLPHGSWEACESGLAIPGDGTDCVIGFDGSYSGDSTALVGCTVGDTPHLWVIDCWEKPEDAGQDWRVPISEVEQAIRVACQRWRVLEVACDPFRWQRSMEALLEEGWPVVEFPTSSPARMVPACGTFYDAVTDKALTHDGDPRLARHIENCHLKIDAKGPRIVKENPMSGRKIDLAVCAVVAHERAAMHREEPESTWFGGWG